MPTFFKMSDEKQTTETPTVIIAETMSSAPPRWKKKYVILAVGAISSVAIILTAILVGMYMFTEAQKDIVKYTLSLNNNAKQEVTSDPNENVVEYHVSSPGLETWIVNDFNKDIQVVKIQSDGETNCYANALNRSTAMDPSKIAKPPSNDIKSASSLIYVTSGTPISDTSFFGKTARDMCNGISVYWVYPQCLDQANANTNDTGMMPRSKRSVDYSPFYYLWYRWNGDVCIAGCCKYLCACNIRYTWVYSGGVLYCTWYMFDCRGNPTQYSSQYGCYAGPRGLTCPNRHPASWNRC